MKNKAPPVGTLLVELVYVAAQAETATTEPLPAADAGTYAADKNGNNLAAQSSLKPFNRQLSAVNRHTGSKLVNAVQQDRLCHLAPGETQIESPPQSAD